VAWDRTNAALGAVCALPGAVVILHDPPRGLGLAFGALPATIVGVAPTRRGRLAMIPVGFLAGVPIAIGGALSEIPVLAVAAVALLAVGAALRAARSRLGAIAMTLCLPMIGVGFSYSAGKAAQVGALIVAGSAISCLLAMLWPERVAADGARASTPRAAPPTLGYGVRLGAAGASAAAIGFALDFDHVGWACAAALLVMRPAAEMQRLRSVGRIVAVVIGALLAIALIRLFPPLGWYSIAAIAALAGAAGSRGSRCYLTPGFTTFLVFLLLLYSHPEQAGSRFGQRVGETLLGVGLAYVFGLALPALQARVQTLARAAPPPP
jgi:hypothetical protein